ncbi:MAG: tetratricopeptide repeat protein [Deltaproteobacteria bacterium]|nr:tetratricopeptide repeat protein [Deltaproteobacteria bacterium]MCB9788041.1 tetratricopeptide repeat protein [Deltaproteobacteria bacterium]
MNCPSCSHRNLSDFPFCEQCLALLPVRPGSVARGAFALDDEGPGPDGPGGPRWPPFPWNPPDLEDPLIGRDRAVRDLMEGFEEVISTWKARIHLLVSESGMGKSRVATTFVERAREREPDVRVIRARCPAHGGPFRMWDAVLRAAFEVPHDADGIVAGARLAQAVREALPEDAAEVTGPIAWLLDWEVEGRPDPGPGTDQEALIGRGTAALARLLATISVERPILIIIDHANTASARSLALAGAVETTVKGRPLMLVLTGSPELAAILPGWDHFPSTRLEALGAADAERMLACYLAGLGPVPRELTRRILDRASGNPFALKSIVRYLRESGAIVAAEGRFVLDEEVAWDLDIPDNLEGVVLAQIGRMPAAVRQTLARAAVVGAEFWVGALVSLERLESDGETEPGAISSDRVPAGIRESLEALAQLRFVERRTSRLPGEEAWGFRSPVHWSTASGILPATTQERYHRVLWQWLLVHAGPRVDEHLVDLARHAEASGAAGDAARFLWRAASRAASEHHHSEARRLLEEAQTLVDPDDLETRLRLDLDLGDALALAGDLEGAGQRYHNLLTSAWRLRHRGHGATALARLGRVETHRGELDRAYAHLLQALRLFQAVEDRAGIATVSLDMGRLFWLRGAFDQALRCYRKSEDVYRALRDRRGLADSLHPIGALHYDRGNLALADEYLGDALDLRRRLDDRAGVAQTLTTLGVVHLARGEAESAVAAWREALALAEERVDLPTQATLADNLGEALAGLGRLDEAREHLERAVSLARDAEQPRILVDALRNLAHLAALAGAPDAAEARLAEARREAARLGIPRLEALIDRTEGDVALARVSADAQADLGPGERAYRRAIAAFEQSGYALEAAVAYEGLAALLGRDAERETDAAAMREAAQQLRARLPTHAVNAG